MADKPGAIVNDSADSDMSIDTKGGTAGREKMMLVAHATVQLLTGESFQLLPFQHAEDVKSEVNKLMESWAKSGFLLRGSRLYPWHQVRLIEVTSVEELSSSQAEQSLTDWQIQDQYHVLDSFWKTKKRQGDSENKKNAGGDGPSK